MLSETERAILDIESKTWLHQGTKEAQAGLATGLSPTRYYQALSALLDREDALAYAPVTVNRLRRMLERRARP